MNLKEVTLTPGLANKLQSLGAKITCKECGFKIPAYVGRYPKACPNCGASLVEGYRALKVTLKTDEFSVDNALKAIREKGITPQEVADSAGLDLTEISFKSPVRKALLVGMDYLMLEGVVETIYLFDSRHRDRIAKLGGNNG